MNAGDNAPLSEADQEALRAELDDLAPKLEAEGSDDGDSMIWLWLEQRRRHILRELEAGHRLPEPDNLDELTGLTSPPFNPEDAPWTIPKTTTQPR